MWPFVRSHLPPVPARVVDLGCGTSGGFVPMLLACSYEAIGIDPEAPEGSQYQRIEFEHARLPEPVDAVIASTSLHHVGDPTHVIECVERALRRGGTVVVIEWAWERFDAQTAGWCFARLGPPDQAGGWLHRRRDQWRASAHDWTTYLREWAEREGLHRGDVLVQLLDERLERQLLTRGPYFFPHLADTTEADEQNAIDAGEIQAIRIDWVGTLQ